MGTRRVDCAAAGSRTLRPDTHSMIPPAREESCPAGLLSGGGLAVVSAVPAGPWLTLMCRDGRDYFKDPEIFEGGDRRPDKLPPDGRWIVV